MSEAWASHADSIPLGGAAGDAPDRTDVLMVAAVDRLGNRVALETDIQHLGADTTRIGETREYGAEYEVGVFDAVRRVWGSTERQFPGS